MEHGTNVRTRSAPHIRSWSLGRWANTFPRGTNTKSRLCSSRRTLGATSTGPSTRRVLAKDEILAELTH